jgi:uncharacterized membrane protein
MATVAAIGIGYLALLANGEEPGPVPLVHLLGEGGAQALLGLGLLGLTLTPVAALAVAAVGFRQRGEHRLVTISLAVIGFLLASAVVAAILTPAV